MNKKVRVSINGFGRIGRAFFKVAWERPDIEIIAINDLGSLESLAYLTEIRYCLQNLAELCSCKRWRAYG
jgi:glyceraldehyde-3-phosphate dehydrogenase/erythrose-4-phosphate dehydrogenase